MKTSLQGKTIVLIILIAVVIGASGLIVSSRFINDLMKDVDARRCCSCSMNCSARARFSASVICHSPFCEMISGLYSFIIPQGGDGVHTGCIVF